jgi:hypothetical protein
MSTGRYCGSSKADRKAILEEAFGHLEEKGFAVIPGVVSEGELCDLRATMRKDILDFTNGKVDVDDPATYKAWRDLYVLHSMLCQHSGVGHLSVSWKVRFNKHIQQIYARLYGVHQKALVVSSDGISFYPAAEHLRTASGRPVGFFRETWFHTDQGPLGTPKGYCRDMAQGLLSLLDATSEDATLLVLTGSHVYWALFFETFPEVAPDDKAKKFNWHKLTEAAHLDFFLSRGCTQVAVPMQAGSLALWNSRTFHCGREALMTRKTPVNRLVVYVCMAPLPGAKQKGKKYFGDDTSFYGDGTISESTKKALAKKVMLYKTGRTTRHTPLPATAFPDVPRTYGGPLPDTQRPKVVPLESLSRRQQRLIGLHRGVEDLAEKELNAALKRKATLQETRANKRQLTQE